MTAVYFQGILMIKFNEVLEEESCMFIQDSWMITIHPPPNVPVFTVVITLKEEG